MPARARWTADRELCALMGGPVAEQDPDVQSPEDEAESNRQWLAARHECGATPLAVEVAGQYIGDVDFATYPNRGYADLTVFLGDRQSWGKGYGTEAVELLIAEILRDARIAFIEVDVAPHNTRALAFWKKLGFTEGRIDNDGTHYLRRHRKEGPNA